MKRILLDLLNVPFFFYSKSAGLISRAYLPSPVNVILLSLYANKFNVNLEEAEKSIDEYHSIYKFFTRKLKEGTRTFSPNPSVVISPCDGVIRDYGEIKNRKLLQAKSFVYSLSSLVGEEIAPIFHNGLYITHYLRPGDYHRFHYPVGGTVEKILYFPGKIFPVNDTSEGRVPGLYTLNERVVVLISTDRGYVALAIVGASAVGEININIWKSLKTNLWLLGKELSLSPGVHVRKGDELGYFGMGSTIITLLEKGKLSEKVRYGEFIKTGTTIATIPRNG